MPRWMRSWGTTIIAWMAVLFIGGAAIAGVSVRSDHTAKSSTEASVHASESESPEATESESPDVETDATGSPNTQDNHGACVSHWAHAAKDSLDGKDFGQFISTVAQSDATGADCEFTLPSASPEATLGASATTHGESSHKNGEHGKSADHKPSDAGPESGSAGS